METPRERFIRLLRSTGTPGIEDLISWLDSPGSDWFRAPASTKYHGAYEGGLVDHSLAVYDELERLYAAYEGRVLAGCITTPQSRILVALLHDLCKVNTYKSVIKSRKNEFGTWEKYQGWEHQEDYKFGGHGSKSVFLISQYIKLHPEEAAAINCHMGPWENGKNQELSAVYNVSPLAWMLHAADEAATFIIQK